MTRWEYLQVYVDGDLFLVASSQGEYLADDDYKSIDPTGKRVVEDRQSLWKSGMGRTRFKLILLNKLGAEGWEAVGNINTGQFYDVFLLLKRPLDN